MFQLLSTATYTIGLIVLVGCTENPVDESPRSSPQAPTYKVNGADSDSVSVLITVRGDLNFDGLEDIAAIVTQDTEGSSVFYYLNVFTADQNGEWQLAGAERLGDRLKLDSLDIYSEGSITSNTGIAVNPDDYGMLLTAYFTRSRGQSFDEEPTLYITKHWRVLDNKLVHIEDY